MSLAQQQQVAGLAEIGLSRQEVPVYRDGMGTRGRFAAIINRERHFQREIDQILCMLTDHSH